MCELVSIRTAADRMGKVADIKKDYILNIIDNAKNCSTIDKIILFGSALENRCTVESDIDIAVFGRKPKYQALRSKDYLRFTSQVYGFGDFQDYDILYFQKHKNNQNAIMVDINRGLVIYQKEGEK